MLVIGNQGVGKNKLVDRLLELLQAEREYVQLHRDTTLQSLTVLPLLDKGRVVYQVVFRNFAAEICNFSDPN